MVLAGINLIRGGRIEGKTGKEAIGNETTAAGTGE